MLGALKNLKDMAAMQKQAQEIQKQLAKEEIVTEKGDIRIVMRGDQQVIEVTIDGEDRRDIKDAMNESIKNVQRLLASKFMQMTQG
ncbi:MAG: Nucleoid-associated protein YbaB [Microgenomates bacterium OLB22]|nr:MAG: Nucleoid-associated protein YbaB [Microgenomates bacterium OLB22]